MVGHGVVQAYFLRNSLLRIAVTKHNKAAAISSVDVAFITPQLRFVGGRLGLAVSARIPEPYIGVDVIGQWWSNINNPGWPHPPSMVIYELDAPPNTSPQRIARWIEQQTDIWPHAIRIDNDVYCFGHETSHYHVAEEHEKMIYRYLLPWTCQNTITSSEKWFQSAWRELPGMRQIILPLQPKWLDEEDVGYSEKIYCWFDKALVAIHRNRTDAEIMAKESKDWLPIDYSAKWEADFPPQITIISDPLSVPFVPTVIQTRKDLLEEFLAANRQMFEGCSVTESLFREPPLIERDGVAYWGGNSTEIADPSRELMEQLSRFVRFRIFYIDWWLNADGVRAATEPQFIASYVSMLLRSPCVDNTLVLIGYTRGIPDEIYSLAGSLGKKIVRQT